MRPQGSFYPVQQLRHGDGGDFNLIVRAIPHPVLEVESALLAPNDDIRVENYRHRSTGALRALRAACKSRCQALASSSGNSVLARASANSRPTQTFSSSGTKRANGEPFLSRTNVIF